MNSIHKLRSYKIGPYAIFDFVLTFIGAYKYGPKVGLSPIDAMLFSLPLSVVVHKLVGRETPLTEQTLGDGNLEVKMLMVLIMIHIVRKYNLA